MDESVLTPRAPFADCAEAQGSGGGVHASDRDGLGLATVALKRGQRSALAHGIGEHFGLMLPDGPYLRSAGGTSFLGTGPGQWLAIREGGGNGFAATLESQLGAWAAVTDQSDGYAVLRLQGPMVRHALAKIVPVDLHDRAFAPGAVAATLASHMGVTLWRLEDHADGSPVFEAAVFRSLAASFWHAFAEGAAQYGLSVARR